MRRWPPRRRPSLSTSSQATCRCSCKTATVRFLTCKHRRRCRVCQRDLAPVERTCAGRPNMTSKNVFGPIAAHRASPTAPAARQRTCAATAGKSFAENVAEFLLEERRRADPSQPASTDLGDDDHPHCVTTWNAPPSASPSSNSGWSSAWPNARRAYRLPRPLRQPRLQRPSCPQRPHAVVALPTPPSDKTTDT